MYELKERKFYWQSRSRGALLMTNGVRAEWNHVTQQYQINVHYNIVERHDWMVKPHVVGHDWQPIEYFYELYPYQTRPTR